MFLPALTVALNGLPVRDGLAYGVHEPHPALAVVPDLRLTGGVHLTVTRGVATLLAPVLAILQGLAAMGPATLLHQVFS